MTPAQVESWLLAQLDQFEAAFCGLDELRIEAVLDERDQGAFDEHWSAAYAQLQEYQAGLSAELRQTLAAGSQRLMQEVFSRVIKVTASSDLAAYVSDDLELIYSYLSLGISHPLVAELLISYQEGRLPGATYH